MSRTFTDSPAVRERTPLLVGLVGPSGSGKTYSALRLATGFQRVTGGRTFYIDTEARRSLHYADEFQFQHLPFGAPFGSLDYLAAIQHCVDSGATTIVVDSMSHEHEGPGGVLEQHDAELTRMGGQLSKSMLAWAKPKADRRRMINGILQIGCNFIFCFRAKEKLKIERGRDPVALGVMPIAGEEFVYEMTINALLLPGSQGTPTWSSDYPGERMMMKLPRQFADLFGNTPQLTEDVGEALANWSAGAHVVTLSAADLIDRYATCQDFATLRTLEDARRASWVSFGKLDQRHAKSASDAAHERVALASTPVPAVAVVSEGA